MNKGLKNKGKNKIDELNVIEEERIHNVWYKGKGYWSEFKGRYVKNRSKELLKESKLKIYDFKFYSIEQIKKDFEYKLWEKIGMFLTVIYEEHLKGYSISNWRRVYMEAEKLRMYLGKNYDVILDRLKELGVIDLEKKINKNNAYQYCRYVALKEGLKNVEGDLYVERNLISESYENSILISRKIKVRRKGLELYIEKVLDKCSFDLGNNRDKIDRLIAEEKYKEELLMLESEYVTKTEKKKITLKLSNKVNYINNLIKIYRDKYDRTLFKLNSKINERREFYDIKVSAFGNRMGHFISYMPKLYRRHLKINGEKVVEVDIVSSQASFLTILLNKWLNSEIKLDGFGKNPWIAVDRLEMIYSKDSRMDLYRYMTYKIHGFKAMFDKKMRGEMKTMFMKIFFDTLKNPEYGGKSKKELIEKIFGADFYELIEHLTTLDVEGIEVGKYRNLSALLQREESKFLNEVMAELMKDKVDFLPLYDCLIVKKSDQKRVKEAFNSIISINGYEGIIKVI
jgi:hypothetical protein